MPFWYQVLKAIRQAGIILIIVIVIRITMETFSKYSKGSGRPAPGSGMPSATSTSLCNEHYKDEHDDKDFDENDDKDDKEDDKHDEEDDDKDESDRVAIELKLSTRMRSSSSLLEMVFVTDTVQLYMIGSAWNISEIIFYICDFFLAQLFSASTIIK